MEIPKLDVVGYFKGLLIIIWSIHLQDLVDVSGTVCHTNPGEGSTCMSSDPLLDIAKRRSTI